MKDTLPVVAGAVLFVALCALACASIGCAPRAEATPLPPTKIDEPAPPPAPEPRPADVVPPVDRPLPVVDAPRGSARSLHVFIASWCGPCGRAKAEIAKSGLRVGDFEKQEEPCQVWLVDFDKQRALAVKWGVDRVPAYVVVDDGVMSEIEFGVLSADQLQAYFERPEPHSFAAAGLPDWMAQLRATLGTSGANRLTPNAGAEKRIQIDGRTAVTLPGVIDLAYRFEGDVLKVEFKGQRPRAEYKRGIKFSGDIPDLSIDWPTLRVTINGLPDQQVRLGE